MNVRMRSSHKVRVTVSIADELVAALDRQVAERRAPSRSAALERWLREGRRREIERRLEESTIAYYEELTAAERAEDAAMARGLSAAARRLDIDGDRPRRGVARRRDRRA
jgi:metal-responsive CopG/Arc/MetJ family transcriptional regulator